MFYSVITKPFEDKLGWKVPCSVLLKIKG